MTTFEQFRKDNRIWKYRYSGQIMVGTIAGGTPSDENVVAGWLRAKLGIDSDDLLREKVAEVMVARKVDANEAVSVVKANKYLNGFRRDEKGLYIEGRQLKAALKEAVSVAYSAGNLNNSAGKNSWGLTKKGIHGFSAEHIMVDEERLYLGITHEEFEARKDSNDGCGVMQHFVHTFQGDSIKYEEYVNDAVIDFTIMCDYEFSEANWAAIWLTGEKQGIGASRSQGYGTYTLMKWDKLK